jgi:hypothetical protein
MLPATLLFIPDLSSDIMVACDPILDSGSGG